MPNRDKLAEFVAWCGKHITGDEKGQAQIFLDRLFQAFGQLGCLDVGGATEFRIRKADEDGGGTAFADYVWKPVVLIEMKKRGENLQKHYRQAFDYWTRLVPNRPRYVVLCNFDEFRVYDFDTDLDTPKDTLALKDLPDRWGPLAFLAPGNPKPNFENDRVAVTTQAADKLADCFKTLIKRGESREMAQKFILQMLVALFAEDIDLLPKYFVTNLLNECKTPADGFDIIGGLFEAMNSKAPKTGGRFKGVPYFNGGLFKEPARIEINDLELQFLKDAASKDWSKVQPEIFGTLFQHSMDDEERHAFGAHFTHPSDIMKIVKPTITDPWSEQIESARTFKRLRELRDRMHTFRVLDPACGSGSFGILQSHTHWLWFTTKCSKLTERFRYTPDTVFDTFPWPQFELGSSRRESAQTSSDDSAKSRSPKDQSGLTSAATIAKIDAVAAAARELRRVRAEALPKLKGGLRALYRTLELPGANPLKDAHAALDTAVLTAYGFSAKKDLLAQLLALNQEVAAKIEKGEPVTAPGVPKNYPDPKETGDGGLYNAGKRPGREQAMNEDPTIAVSKVSQVTLVFWIVKILCTTLGETGGDALSMSMNLGYLLSTIIFGVIFVAAVAVQILTKKFNPTVYWSTIIATTTVGTTLADFADRSLGIGYAGGTSILLVMVLASLWLWKHTLGSVAVDTVNSPKAEIFYWVTIMCSQTLGTALGDWTADTAGIGYGGGIVVFGGILAVIAGGYFWTKISHSILFWAAFIMTRPLGAVVGDLLDKPRNEGGLALSRYSASGVLLLLIVFFIFTFSHSPAADLKPRDHARN